MSSTRRCRCAEGRGGLADGRPGEGHLGRSLHRLFGALNLHSVAYLEIEGSECDGKRRRGCKEPWHKRRADQDFYNDDPQKGSILLDGSDIIHMSRMELARQLGYIPQSDHQSFPATVFDVVLMGRRPHIGWRSGQKDKEKVLDVLEMLNIEHPAMKDINEISGGQTAEGLDCKSTGPGARSSPSRRAHIQPGHKASARGHGCDQNSCVGDVISQR